MVTQPDRDEASREEEARRESGVPGGGAGRREEVGGSGVYPASAGRAPAGAEVRTQAAWGHGEDEGSEPAEPGAPDRPATEPEERP